MAHQSATIPIKNPRTEPISWPNPEENMPQAISPAETSTTANDIYQSCLSAAERSLRVTQRGISNAATSFSRSARRFADDRPLQFVGVVAGVAFITGVALRIWRSNSHA